MTDLSPQVAPDAAVYKTLLESTRAIPWRIEWASQRFTYIGPQIGDLLGWTPESWVSVNDWAERIHPEDRERVVAFCVAQSQQGVDHEADYRALTREGGYVWIRDVVHVVRRGDEVEALIGFMFDISERKRNEQELQRLQSELEVLSFRDGLTGVANRRMFDVVFEREWASAQREQRPLSLILLDIDFFKAYNDYYGHLAGDDCLKAVADVLLASAVRPRDLVARFGGEEFVLVLPETDAAAVRHVAERCRAALAAAGLPHARSAVSASVTISQGLASCVPGVDSDRRLFLNAADQALYRAKARGRDCLEVAS